MMNWKHGLNARKAKQYSTFCTVLCLNIKAMHMMLESTREFITESFPELGISDYGLENLLDPFYRAGLAFNELKDSLLCEEENDDKLET